MKFDSPANGGCRLAMLMSERIYRVTKKLRLASWPYVNHQRLVKRQLDPLGQHIGDYFEASDKIESLVEQWVHKQRLVDVVTLARIFEAVSFEIRIAARLRRGLDISSLQAPRRLKLTPLSSGLQ